MKKKTISIILATALSIQSVYAGIGESANFGEYGLGYVGKVKGSGSGIGGKYMVGGNYVFKTKPNNPPLFFTATAPQAKLGCGGFSFSGMKASIIDTSQLQEAISNAGGAMAWGVMMGMITSLPTLKETFSEIQKFAREIQKLLANACNLGESLGTNIASKYGVKTATEKIASKVNKLDKSMAQKLQKSGEGMTGLLPDFLADSKGDGATQNVPEETIQSAALSAIESGLAITGITNAFIYSLANREKNSGATKGIMAFLKDEGVIDTTHKKIATKTITLDMNDFFKIATEANKNSRVGITKFEVLVTALIRNIVGTKGLRKDTITAINAILDEINKPDGQFDKDSLKTALQDYHVTMINGTPSNAVPISSSDSFTADDFINWMVKGKNEILEGGQVVANSNANTYLEDLTEKLYKPAVFAAAAPSSGDTTNNKNTYTYFLVDMPSTTKFDQGNSDWKTAFKNHAGLETLAELQVKCMTDLQSTYVNDDICKNMPPLLVGNPVYYMKVFKQSPASSQVYLEDVLITANKIEWLYATKLVLAKIVKQIYSFPYRTNKDRYSEKSAPAGYSNETVKELKQAISKIDRKLNEMIKETIKKTGYNRKAIDDIFTKQDMLNIKRAMQPFKK